MADSLPPPSFVDALADRYAFEREVGRGGMATVFLARDLRHDRPVAVKLLRADLSPSLGVDRFLREIRIAARLSHPHIVPVLDSGEAAGIVFFVMPYVSGESLRARLRREPQLPVKDAVQIAREVADALGFAHAQGIIHRDIKPENILLEAGHAVVMDFGIARALTGGPGDALTETGIVLGTPAYMSPEQATGSGQVDQRSDLYSLACVLYEMLAGELPFHAATPQAALAKKAAALPPPAITSVRGTVPGWIAEALTHALAPLPADRPGSTLEFAAALEDEDRQPVAGETIAVLPFANMSADAENEYFSDGITEEVINAVAALPNLRVTARTSAFQFKGQQRDIQEIGRKLRVDRVIEGSVRRAGTRLRITAQLVSVADGYQLWSERFDRDLEDVFAIQDEIAEAIALRVGRKAAPASAEPAPGQEATTASDARSTTAWREQPRPEAYDAYLRGRYLRRQMFSRPTAMDGAADSYREAIRLDASFAPAWSALAELEVVRAIGFATAPSRELMAAAGTAAERALSLDAGLAEAQLARALVAMYRDWDYPAAWTGISRGIAINPSSVEAHFWAEFYFTYVERDMDRALDANRRAHALDPLDLNIQARQVQVLVLFDRLDDAIRRGTRLLEIEPDHMVTHLVVADAWLRRGDHAKAMASVERAIDLSGRAIVALGVAGVLFGCAGEMDRARAMRDELDARATQGYVFPFWRAVVCAALGQLDEAFDLLADARRDRDPNLLYLSATPRQLPWRSDPRFGECLRDIGLGRLAE